jgi:SMC interacting uncharacterized protein involved in chromosome segregation
MKKEELIKENIELREQVQDLEQNLEVTYDGQRDLEKRLTMAEDAIKRHREGRIFLEGQVDVFKRLLKTHPEQVPTREEFKEGQEGYGREILSSVELPF